MRAYAAEAKSGDARAAAAYARVLGAASDAPRRRALFLPLDNVLADEAARRELELQCRACLPPAGSFGFVGKAQWLCARSD